MALVSAISAGVVNGNDFDVTLSAGADANKAIYIALAGNLSSVTTLTAATLNGAAADYIYTPPGGGIDGGRALSFGLAVWLDAKHPGNGTHLLETTGITNSDLIPLVVEAANVSQDINSVTNLQWATAIDQADGSSISTTQNAASELALSFIGTGDSSAATQGLHSPSANLTGITSVARTDTSLMCGYDAETETASESYSWGISHNGSAVVDSIVTCSFIAGSTQEAGSLTAVPAQLNLSAQAQVITTTGTVNAVAASVEAAGAPVLVHTTDPSWDFGVITDPNGFIYQNDTGITVGDFVRGYWSSGDGVAHLPSGNLSPDGDSDVYQYQVWNSSTGVWGGLSTVTFPGFVEQSVNASKAEISLVAQAVVVAATGTVNATAGVVTLTADATINTAVPLSGLPDNRLAMKPVLSSVLKPVLR